MFNFSSKQNLHPIDHLFVICVTFFFILQIILWYYCNVWMIIGTLHCLVSRSKTILLHGMENGMEKIVLLWWEFQDFIGKADAKTLNFLPRFSQNLYAKQVYEWLLQIRCRERSLENRPWSEKSSTCGNNEYLEKVHHIFNNKKINRWEDLKMKCISAKCVHHLPTDDKQNQYNYLNAHFTPIDRLKGAYVIIIASFISDSLSRPSANHIWFIIIFFVVSSTNNSRCVFIPSPVAHMGHLITCFRFMISWLSTFTVYIFIYIYICVCVCVCVCVLKR